MSPLVLLPGFTCKQEKLTLKVKLFSYYCYVPNHNTPTHHTHTHVSHTYPHTPTLHTHTHTIHPHIHTHVHMLDDSNVDIEGAPPHVMAFMEHYYSIPWMTYRYSVCIVLYEIS